VGEQRLALASAHVDNVQDLKFWSWNDKIESSNNIVVIRNPGHPVTLARGQSVI
jgi:hypothetical protein